ncbi:hypothetical protein A5698_20955 [Mycobacterium sp. E136]|uniref:AAA family ATPase n=1 Tax=Mycobacterium sp. E136 TaxID=1834125 RepID=UPI000801C96B|nr:AAA family ATPase [Mycobacterium sp. E136]OBG91252.1 hypothetical protein A5698_20955 [Mycobacterium sp. E136]
MTARDRNDWGPYIDWASGPTRAARAAERSEVTTSTRRATTPATRAWIERGVAAGAAELAATGRGQRNDALNRFAHRWGQFPDADRQAVYVAAQVACQNNGLLADDGPRAFEATFDSGWNSGRAEPGRYPAVGDDWLGRIGQTNGAAAGSGGDPTLPSGGSNTTQADNAQLSGGQPGAPRLWRATDLKPAEQPRFLARDRIPRAAVTVLIGEEGIGKSLLWVLLVAAITTGKGLPEFSIPTRDPAEVLLIITEDDWATAVLPRLQVAGADLDRIQVVCADRDGSGSPIFPTDMGLVIAADPAPALIVVDAWLDTVGTRLLVRDPQQARAGLHPWKEAANATGAAVLLLAHTNRQDSTNIRDRYGATAALRQKARMTLFCLPGETEGGTLIVGPDKANSATTRTKASLFDVRPIEHFDPTPDHDGTVPLLRFVRESDRTIKEHLADETAAAKRRPPTEAEVWVRAFFERFGPTLKASEVYSEAETEGFSADQCKRAKKSINGSGDGFIRVYRDADASGTGPWWWEWVSTGTQQTSEDSEGGAFPS